MGAELRQSLQAELVAKGIDLLGPCNDLCDLGDTFRQAAPLIEQFGRDELIVLGGYMHKISASPGAALLREGELGGWLLLIFSGSVDVSKKDAKGQPSRLAVVRMGSALGEMSMMDFEPRNASATALDPVTGGLLTREAVGQLIAEHPGVGAKLLVHLVQMLATRLRNTNKQFVGLVAAHQTLVAATASTAAAQA